jgi:hypothetical protein
VTKFDSAADKVPNSAVDKVPDSTADKVPFVFLQYTDTTMAVGGGKYGVWGTIAVAPLWITMAVGLGVFAVRGVHWIGCALVLVLVVVTVLDVPVCNF